MSDSLSASSEIISLAERRRRDTQELSDLWDAAEKHLKRTEHVLRELTTSASNELRYAGYHLVRSLAAPDADAYAEQSGKARKHCKRAIYDANEALLMHFLGKIERFQDDYSTVPVLPVVPHYLDILSRAKEARKLVLSTAPDDGDGFHEQARISCDSLERDCETIDIAREELNKAIQSQRNKAKAVLVTIAVTVLVGLIGAAATLYAASAPLERSPRSAIPGMQPATPVLPTPTN